MGAPRDNPRDRQESPDNRRNNQAQNRGVVVEDGPSPQQRTITTHQDVSSLDPIKRYYSTTKRAAFRDAIVYDDGSNNLQNYATRQRLFIANVSTTGSGKIGNPNLYRAYEAPNSNTVNWSGGGYHRSYAEPGFSAANPTEANRWNDAFNNRGPVMESNFVTGDQTKRSYFRMSQAIPSPTGQAADFNFATEISSLAISASAARLPPDEERQYLMRLGPTSPEVARQIGQLGIGVSEFTRNYRAMQRQTNQRNQRLDGQLVQTLIDQYYPIPVAHRAALAAYDDNLYSSRSSGSYVDYEFHNFQIEAPLVLDWLSHESELVGGSNNPPPTTPAYINPEYNFYNGVYEKAIAENNIPETVLPNMYVYSLMTAEPFDMGANPAWQEGPEKVRVSAGRDQLVDNPDPRRAAELQGDYDKLITLDEFDKNFLPRTDDPDFVRYLDEYGAAISSGSVSVDMYANLDRKNASTITPAGDMDIYPKFNTAKHAFPMYIEVGMPTNAVGNFGKLAEKTGTSAGFMSSLTTTQFDTKELHFSTDGLLTTAGDGNPFEIDEARAAPEMTSNLFSRQASKVYDFDDWFDNIASSAILAVLTQKGIDFPVGVSEEDCLDHMTQLAVSGMRNSMRQAAATNVLSYKDYALAAKPMCQAETIIFELSKFKKTGDNNYALVQNYFFPNTSYTDVIDYVDTQVKYNQIYRYELTGYAVVYGAKYRFRTQRYVVGADDGGFRARPGADLNFTFNVETIPDLKIVEYPIFNGRWMRSQGEDRLVGGLNYPDVKVMDRPPMPPEYSVFPYKTDHEQILINLQPGGGAFMGDRAVKYIALSEDDEENFRQLSFYQKRVENFGLKQGHLEFRSEGGGEVTTMEVYRTTDLASGLLTSDLIYKNFEGRLHKILDINQDSELPDEDLASAFDLMDTLVPNTKYYYTFRSRDIHDHVSNPSAIYQVELLYDKGFYAPEIKIYNPPEAKLKKPIKKFSRFLEIQAADIQSLPYYQQSDNPADEFNQNHDIGLVSEQDDRVENNQYIVRITSRDTGRKIDLRVKFRLAKEPRDT
jgi:hypothetical protein